jgi:hypothetical protein
MALLAIDPIGADIAAVDKADSARLATAPKLTASHDPSPDFDSRKAGLFLPKHLA